ncbi:NAD-dependent epimerase/dehydratase family protein [Streptosporangium sp. NBC_01756]|uniref:NAD-dependent epimerase/dehydratase family protein n=1 Tax=Streptosporangium sp. NBC_01756 TaxID=2975950 RepID=UPI002DD95D4B|nr:NAD-dependent epimerase/dehydratase family protein [Streptosporangium sp. NBC_01756]WSC89554.1 NAD-dependent epimerase/dehydratase family protein [Streptosporangium sp. NBC_01756]
MHILIIGGTRFVGRHITEAAIAAGHEVSLLHRGQTGPDLFPEAEHLRADRNADLSILRDRRWDATIDVSAYVPSQIVSLAGAVSTGQYVFVSSTSVYAVPEAPGFTEDSPLTEFDGPVPETVTGETYGALKVACERTAVDSFGPETLIVRPTYVIGPYDYTGRFTYWVNRIARGGEVLAPGDPSAPIQVIDGRDMATWIIAMIEKAASGTFHAVSPAPPFSFGDMLEAIVAEVGPPGTTLTWVGTDFLLAAGQDGRSLPLWSAGDAGAAANTADPAAATAAGLSPRPLGRSVREIHASEADFSTDTTLSPDREAELLAGWRSRSQG